MRHWRMQQHHMRVQFGNAIAVLYERTFRGKKNHTHTPTLTCSSIWRYMIIFSFVIFPADSVTSKRIIISLAVCISVLGIVLIAKLGLRGGKGGEIGWECWVDAERVTCVYKKKKEKERIKSQLKV